MYFFLLLPHPPQSTLFPYTTLFRSRARSDRIAAYRANEPSQSESGGCKPSASIAWPGPGVKGFGPCPSPMRARPASRIVVRSEEHTSELQSRENLVCRLLLEKKNNK